MGYIQKGIRCLNTQIIGMKKCLEKFNAAKVYFQKILEPFTSMNYAGVLAKAYMNKIPSPLNHEKRTKDSILGVRYPSRYFKKTQKEFLPKYSGQDDFECYLMNLCDYNGMKRMAKSWKDCHNNQSTQTEPQSTANNASQTPYKYITINFSPATSTTSTSMEEDDSDSSLEERRVASSSSSSSSASSWIAKKKKKSSSQNLFQSFKIIGADSPSAWDQPLPNSPEDPTLPIATRLRSAKLQKNKNRKNQRRTISEKIWIRDATSMYIK